MFLFLSTISILTASFSCALLPTYFSRDRMTDELQNNAHLNLGKEQLDTLKRMAAVHKKMRKYDELMTTLKTDPYWRPTKKQHWEDLMEMSYLNNQLEGYRDKINFIRNHMLWGNLQDPDGYSATHPRQEDDMSIDAAHRNWEDNHRTAMTSRRRDILTHSDRLKQLLAYPTPQSPQLQHLPSLRQPQLQQPYANLPHNQQISTYPQNPRPPSEYPQNPQASINTSPYAHFPDMHSQNPYPSSNHQQNPPASFMTSSAMQQLPSMYPQNQQASFDTSPYAHFPDMYPQNLYPPSKHPQNPLTSFKTSSSMQLPSMYPQNQHRTSAYQPNSYQSSVTSPYSHFPSIYPQNVGPSSMFPSNPYSSLSMHSRSMYPQNLPSPPTYPPYMPRPIINNPYQVLMGSHLFSRYPGGSNIPLSSSHTQERKKRKKFKDHQPSGPPLFWPWLDPQFQKHPAGMKLADSHEQLSDHPEASPMIGQPSMIGQPFSETREPVPPSPLDGLVRDRLLQHNQNFARAGHSQNQILNYHRNFQDAKNAPLWMFARSPDEQFISNTDLGSRLKGLDNSETQRISVVGDVAGDPRDRALAHGDREDELRRLPAWQSLQNTNRDTVAKMNGVVTEEDRHRKKQQDIREIQEDLVDLSQLQVAMQKIFDHHQRLDQLEKKVLQLKGDFPT